MIECQFERQDLRIESSGGLRSVAQLAMSRTQRSMCPLGSRHRLAAFVILAAVLGAVNLVARDGQRRFDSSGLVMMAFRHL